MLCIQWFIWKMRTLFFSHRFIFSLLSYKQLRYKSTQIIFKNEMTCILQREFDSILSVGFIQFSPDISQFARCHIKRTDANIWILKMFATAFPITCIFETNKLIRFFQTLMPRHGCFFFSKDFDGSTSALHFWWINIKSHDHKDCRETNIIKYIQTNRQTLRTNCSGLHVWFRIIVFSVHAWPN